MLIPILMAGGSGTRLWPLSRQFRPKQFLPIMSEKSMLQETLGRLDGISCAPPWIICNEKHRFLAAEQARNSSVSIGHIFLEPISRNTAPAVALMALQALKNNADAILLILPADHVIEDIVSFQKSVHAAISVAKNKKLVALGIVPNKPETGYGYIKVGNQFSDISQTFVVESFFEKPDAVLAKKYVDSGHFLWNSGIFVFSAEVYIEELKKFFPNIVTHCEAALKNAVQDLDFIRFNLDDLLACDDISIDYAVMEKTSNAAVVTLEARWHDLGSWDALWETAEKDDAGNVVRGDVEMIATSNTYVFAQNRLVALSGVNNLVVVETNDAVLVANKGSAEKIKMLVEKMKDLNRNELLQHSEVYRPWGMYESIGQGNRYQVKKIVVNPGARLSVQKHHHRAEHWIVVSGTAKVMNADKEYLVTENQSTYIPVGQVHCLENPGIIPLELIEIQSGTYLGEDDIVRLEDIYGRL